MWYLMYTEVRWSGPRTEEGYKEYCYTEQVHVQWGYAITNIQPTASELEVKYKFKCIGRFNTKEEAILARDNHREYGIAEAGLDMKKIEEDKKKEEEQKKKEIERKKKDDERKAKKGNVSKNIKKEKQATLIIDETKKSNSEINIPWMNANLKVRDKNEK